jgi:hypothetical protein
MSPKTLIIGAALLGLGGCVAAPYSPDTGYSQGYPAYYGYSYSAPTYYQQPGYYYSPGYVAEAPAPAYACGSGTAVGTLGGAAAGGLIGSQFGHGSGKAGATIAGIAGGALLGGAAGNNYDRSAGC